MLALGLAVLSAAFPGDAAYQVASGSAKATVISGARVRVHEIVFHQSSGGAVHLRALGSSTDSATLSMPVAIAAQGLDYTVPLHGMLFPDGLQIVVDPGVTGEVIYEEEPRESAHTVVLSITLDQVRQILGKSTPHPFHGQDKWGVFPTETASDEQWDSGVDSEVFHVQLPTGYTTGQGGAGWRLILGHHHLKNIPDTVAILTDLDELCDERGYIFCSPTSMLTDTWPNDTSVDNLDAVLWWLIRVLNVDDDDLNLVGFSLGGQQVSRFSCTHRDPIGLMARSVCAVAPDWEQLVWQRKQHKNTNLGATVPNPPGAQVLCDPNPATATSSVWRSQQQRLDQMGGPWPGGDNLSAIGLQWRASGILALDPASYAETGPMTDADPATPVPSALDLKGAIIDDTRSLAASGLWTPTLIYWGEDDAIIIIPPLTLKLLELYATVNPSGQIGYQPLAINVGVWGGYGAHTWDILDEQDYLDWVEQVPPLERYPRTFEYVTHRDSTSSYCTLTRSAVNDLSRFRVQQVLVQGAEGWIFSHETRVKRIVIDAARTELAHFAFGPGAPLHVSTSTDWEIVVKNLLTVPSGATGVNIGAVIVGVDGPNSILIRPAGPGAIVASIF
jgi:pimeloyl-ACP methyl ester carboxylesterase